MASQTVMEAPVSTAEPRTTSAPRAAGAQIVRNVLVLSVGQVFTWVSAAGMAVLLPRYLGDVNLGRLGLAFSFTQFFGIAASLGISSYLTREVARGGTQASSLVLNALIMRLPLAFAAALLAVISASLLQYEELTRQLVYLYSINIALSAISGVLSGALQGFQEMRPVAVANTVSKMGVLGLAALFLVLGYGPVGVAVAWDVSAAAGVLIMLVPTIRLGALQGHVSPRVWQALFIGGLPFLVWEMSLLLYGQIDVILLGSLTHEAVIGWYGAAYRVISVPGFIPGIVMTALLPAMLSASHTSRAMFHSLARRGLQVVLLATIPVALGIAVLPDKIIEFLGYPPEFNHSIPLILILALHIPLTGADMIVGTALNALDKQRQWAITAVAAAVLNPALNAALIPLTQSTYGNGAIGAAIVTVLTEVFMMAMGLRLLHGSGIFDMSVLVSAIKCVVAGLVMVVVVWTVRTLPLPLTIGIGAVAYCGASFMIGTLSVRDLRVLFSYVLSRTRGRSSASI